MTRAEYATITALNIYPVKSCRGISLDPASIAPTGFANDRRWMVVSDAARFLTQRELPRLALVVPALNERALLLTAPGMPELSVPREGGGPKVEVTVWQDRCAALDAGPEAAAWFSEFLGRTVRLVRFDPTHVRPSNRQWTGETDAFNEFSDGFPILAISQASLDDLNTRLSVPLPMNRFRPNLVLAGLQPYDEDRIHELVSGEVRLRIVKPCTRCKITTTDQATGEVIAPEPLKTLREYRWSPQLRGVMFGQNIIVANGIGAELHVGERLTIVWK